MRLRGKVTDYGDLIHHEEWIVKGRHYGLTWHVHSPRKTLPADRVSLTEFARAFTTAQTRKDCTVDLQDDQQVTLNIEYTDDVGNPVPAPDGAAVAYTVDNADVINLTDNGDGSAVAAATGTLGSATVHAVADLNGLELTGDLNIVVVTGLAARMNIVAGPPENVLG